MTAVSELIAHLNNGQQADEDGVTVIVSRHAVAEAVRLLRLLGETEEALAACQSQAGRSAMTDLTDQLRIAESEDTAVNALEEYLKEAPFSREEWARLDTERRELLTANDALAEQLAEVERILGVAADAIEERCSGLTGDPLQPIADLIGDYYRGREAAPTWPAPFGARGHRGASCACHMDVGQWRTDCPLHGFQRTTVTVTGAPNE